MIGAQRLIAFAFTIVLCVGTAAHAEDPRTESVRKAFAMVDQNGDGKVTFEEFEAQKIITFSAHDKNQDNSLSRDEVHFTREQFDALDHNKDGKISGLEFDDSPLGRFETYDLNKDGFIDLQEFMKILVGK